MPINEKDIPVVRVLERTGPVIERIKKAPTRKLQLHLIPAEERGWHKKITYEKPIKNSRTGKIDLYQYTYERDRFPCARCGTNKYMLLILMGWDYAKYRSTRVKGSGVHRRCFKCDMLNGPLAEEKRYCEVKIIDRDISLERAKKIVKQYGLVPSSEDLHP